MTQSACSAARARGLVLLVAGLAAGVVPALATPWWEAYEGDVYPETLPG